MNKLRAHLVGAASRPHRGVWDGAGSASSHDYAALAAWAMRDRPEYFRELLAARVLAQRECNREGSGLRTCGWTGLGRMMVGLGLTSKFSTLPA